MNVNWKNELHLIAEIIPFQRWNFWDSSLLKKISRDLSTTYDIDIQVIDDFDQSTKSRGVTVILGSCTTNGKNKETF